MHRKYPLTLTLLLLDQENRRLSYQATRKRRSERGAGLVRVPSRACAPVEPVARFGDRNLPRGWGSGSGGRRVHRARPIVGTEGCVVDATSLFFPGHPPSGRWPRAKAAASPRDRPPAAGPIPPSGRCGRRRGPGGRPSRDRPSAGLLRCRLRPASERRVRWRSGLSAKVPMPPGPAGLIRRVLPGAVPAP